jgi:hypothetical protein
MGIQLYVFSLEGCAQQGFLKRLKDFEWDHPIMLPEDSRAQVDKWRAGLRTTLWVEAHFTALLLAFAGGVLLWKGLTRYLKRRHPSTAADHASAQDAYDGKKDKVELP